MKSKVKFYRCKHCGNIIVKVEDHGVPVVCCGEKMELLQVGVVDASLEKHVPEVVVSDRKVEVVVGSVLHPMTEEHHISWIYLETEHGGELRYLEVGQEPKAVFCTQEKLVGVYAYCNLHGLWMSEVK